MPGFGGSQGESWSFWPSGAAPIVASDWVSPSFGATDRVLFDGSYDGFSLNIFGVINTPPSVVPEPTAGFLLLAASGASLVIRRRGRAA